MRDMSISIDGEVDDNNNKLSDDEYNGEETEGDVFHDALDDQLSGTEN